MRKLLLGLVLSLSIGNDAGADGPWSASVVDPDDQGKPVSDVVVIAVWWKRFPGVMHEGASLHDVIEVVTDSGGRFVIPARRAFTLIPFVRIDGPRVQMFKAGYNGWRFAGEPPVRGPMNTVERDRWIAAAWRRFATVGEEIHLARARTWQERQRAFVIASPPGDISAEKIPRYRKALQAEGNWLTVHRP